MNRRIGQNGTIVVQSGWYRVRWRVDIDGQSERRNMTAKVAPVIFDKTHNPKPASLEVRRLARKIVEESGANSEHRFNQVVLGEKTFRDQAKHYLHWVTHRDREPLKDVKSVTAALNKWILPAIGDMPLSNVNNVTVKPLVEEMKKSLSSRSVNKYVEYIRQVVASLKNPDTGEPIHVRKWDSGVMDLPLVNQKQQRRPYLNATSVGQLVQQSSGSEQALYVLLASTGMRISEALALESKHFTNDVRTIEVRQQVDRHRPRIVGYLKTDAASRDVDVSRQVAEYLRNYIGHCTGLLFKTRNNTPYLHNSIEARWLTPKLVSMGLDEIGMGFHAFRRFRKTWLRGKRCQEDINNFWMGHKPKSMSELYSRMDAELEQRLQEAETVGVGFEIPAYVAPTCSKTLSKREVAIAA